MFFNFEKYYGLYKALDFSVTRIKMANEGKCKCYLSAYRRVNSFFRYS